MNDLVMTCKYCGSDMPEQEFERYVFVCPLCGWRRDRNEYIRSWKIAESPGYCRKELVLHPNVNGWIGFCLVGTLMRPQPDFGRIVPPITSADK